MESIISEVLNPNLERIMGKIEIYANWDKKEILNYYQYMEETYNVLEELRNYKETKEHLSISELNFIPIFKKDTNEIQEFFEKDLISYLDMLKNENPAEFKKQILSFENECPGFYERKIESKFKEDIDLIKSDSKVYECTSAQITSDYLFLLEEVNTKSILGQYLFILNKRIIAKKDWVYVRIMIKNSEGEIIPTFLDFQDEREMNIFGENPEEQIKKQKQRLNYYV